MMKVFIAYANEKYQRARNFAGKMARRFGGFDKIILYGPEDIDSEFIEKYKETFSIKRGAGLWLWKSYIINKALKEECQLGDYLFYSDSGAFFIRSVDYIIRAMGNENIFVSCVPLVEWQFSKRDAFQLMNCDTEEFRNSAQVQSGFICLRKSKQSDKFAIEYLHWCCDLKVLHSDNIASGQLNPKGFIASREDQTVLSLLCKKYAVRPHRDPCQFGKYPEKYWLNGFFHAENIPYKEYPILILLHRTPRVNKKVVLKQLLLIIMPRCIGVKFIKRKNKYIVFDNNNKPK